MDIAKTQLDAERAVHESLNAGDETTLVEFAEFAAGEIDDKHIAALLLAILQPSARAIGAGLAAAIPNLEKELERQRAKFIEAYAKFQLEKAALDEMAKAEVDASLRESAK